MIKDNDDKGGGKTKQGVHFCQMCEADNTHTTSNRNAKQEQGKKTTAQTPQERIQEIEKTPKQMRRGGRGDNTSNLPLHTEHSVDTEQSSSRSLDFR